MRHLCAMGRYGVVFLLCLSVGIWSGSRGQLQPNCPQHVEEGQDLACECVYKTSSPPSITPVFSWVGQSNTTQLRKPGVNRSDNGTVYTCEMRMGSNITYVNYTLQVVYGPSAANVIIKPRQPIFVNGSNPVTLTCVATEVNPRPTFTWTGLPCVEGQDKDTCTFTPTWPDDEGKNVTCSVYNYFVSTGSGRVNNTLTLRLSLSPTSPATTTTTTTTTTSVTTTERATTVKVTTEIPTTATTATKTSPSSGATSSRSSTLPSSATSDSPSDSTQSGPLSTQPSTTDDVSSTADDVSSTTDDVSSSTDDVSSTTDDVSSSTDDVSSTTDGGREEVDGAQFPLAGVVGGLSGAFVLLLIIIIVVVVCRRKKERDISLVRSGDIVDGSYKNSATKDFYSYDNNGYNQDGMLESHHKNHHHHHHHNHQQHPPSLPKHSRHMDMERALEIYQAVPTVPVSSNNNNISNSNNNNSADPDPEVEVRHDSGRGHQDPELGDDAPHQDWEDARRTETVVRFENPAYSPAPASSSPGTMEDAAGTPVDGGETGTQAETGTSPETGTPPPQVGTPSDPDTPPGAGRLTETRRNLDWGAFQPAEEPEEEETLADAAGTLLDWGTQPDTGDTPRRDPTTTTTNDVYARVNKPTPSTPPEMETASPQAGLDPTGAGRPEDDTYPPQSESPQQVGVSSDRSSTIITLANNHNVPEEGHSQ